MLFATPVSIAANTTYVASYHAPNGKYAVDTPYFASSGVDNPPLRALANGVDGPNGVYLYGPSGFPTSSFNAANYWVDVVFETDTTPDTEVPVVSVTAPAEGATVSGVVALDATASDNVGVVGVQFQVNGVNEGAEDTVAPYTVNWDSTAVANGAYQITAIARDAAGNTTTSTVVNVTVDNAADTTAPTVVSVTPVNGATNVAPSIALTVLFDEAMDPASIDGTTVELRDGAGNLVAAVVSYDGGTRTAALTPSAALAETTTYNALVRGGATDPRVKDTAGNALSADFTWSFTTGAPSAFSSIWNDATVPAVASQPDAQAIEVGVKFQANVAGNVAGIRFYKGTDNTGTHVGTLWDSAGTQLAQATFANETASGWQTVLFGTPVAIAAGTTYVASYHTTVGFYSADVGYFATAFDNPPLRALANGEDGPNGVYTYSATPIFPG